MRRAVQGAARLQQAASLQAKQLFRQEQLGAGGALRRFQWTDSKGYTHFEKRGGSAYWARKLQSPYVQAGAVGTATLGGVYWYNSLEEIPYTHRRHSMLFVSKQREKELGAALFQMIRKEAALTHTLLPPHHPFVAAVKRAGARVAKIAGEGHGGGVYEHMRSVEWEFAVINSPVPNAFVAPGGKVVVYTALLELLSSEEELAAVLAHETAHVLARHTAERMSSLNLWTLIKVGAWLFLGIGLPNAVFALGIFLPYSRRAEHEADAIGLQLMARACFDPMACTTMLQKLHNMEKKHPLSASTPGFLRTHPLSDERVQKVKDALPEAYKAYKAAGCHEAVGFLWSFAPDVMQAKEIY